MGGALLLPTMKFKQIPTAGGVNPSPTLPNYIFGMGCLGLCPYIIKHCLLIISLSLLSAAAKKVIFFQKALDK